jgi:hypothetical protein
MFSLVMAGQLSIHFQGKVKMQSVIRYGTIVVVIHSIVVALHGLAHEKMPVPLSPLQSLFVGSIIVLAPLAAMILLWTPLQQAGSWLLLSSMAGAMLFGLYHHFQSDRSRSYLPNSVCRLGCPLPHHSDSSILHRRTRMWS